MVLVVEIIDDGWLNGVSLIVKTSESGEGWLNELIDV